MFKINKIFLLVPLALIFFALVCTSTPLVHAQPAPGTYVPLAPLPSAAPAGGTDLATYAKGLFALLIGVAAVLAVIMIVIGGVQYMSTDAISGKSDGKDKITQALYGLFIAIACWLILYTINPNLLKFDVLSGVPNSPTNSTPPPPPGPYYKVRVCTAPNGTPQPIQRLGTYTSQEECDNAPPTNIPEDPPYPGCGYSEIDCTQLPS